MRHALDKIYKKLKICEIGEETEWKDGYVTGLTEALEILQEGIDELIVPNNNYFVIMYDGDRRSKHIEEMCLYKIGLKNRKYYYFTRQLYANRLEIRKPDLVIASLDNLRKRVFFSREQAEKAIGK